MINMYLVHAGHDFCRLLRNPIASKCVHDYP